MIYRVSAEVLHLCHYKDAGQDPFRDPSVVCGLSLLNPRNRGDLPPSLITDIARFPNLVAEEDFTNLKEVFLSF